MNAYRCTRCPEHCVLCNNARAWDIGAPGHCPYDFEDFQDGDWEEIA